MALIRLLSGKEVGVPAEKAELMWKVLQREVEGTEAQQAYCMTIDKILLNWRNPSTPYSYLHAHKDALVALSRMHSVRLPELSNPYPDRLTDASGKDRD